MVHQKSPNDRPLRTSPLPVNQPHFQYACLPALPQILFNHRSDLLRRKGVQVKDLLDGKPHRLFERLLWRSAHGITLSFLAGFSTVTALRSEEQGVQPLADDADDRGQE